MSDELYYLDCANHLAWGYVDHPPFCAAALWLVRLLLGSSIAAIRLLPALAGAGTMLVCALMARELGGGRIAQSLAALAALISPLYLAVGGFYSMNGLEPLLWALAAYLLLRIFNGGDRRLWIAFGAVVGIGLLNKISMACDGRRGSTSVSGRARSNYSGAVLPGSARGRRRRMPLLHADAGREIRLRLPQIATTAA